MGPLAHCRANRVRTATNPFQGGAFHQRPQRLFIQAYRHGDAGPLPHRRTPRARSRQLSQVIPALSLISPRLNLLISHRNSAKKTLTHSKYRIRNSSVAPWLLCHHRRQRRHRRQIPSPTPTRPRQWKGRRCALLPLPHAGGAAHESSCAAPFRPSRNPSAGIRQPESVSRNPSGYRLTSAGGRCDQTRSACRRSSAGP